MSKTNQKVLNPIYHQTKEKIATPKNRKTNTRIACFLKPWSCSSQGNEIPKTKPLLYEIFSHTTFNIDQQQKWPVKVQFSGFRRPIKDWKLWFVKLAVKYGTHWMEVGILDGILSSMHEIQVNYDVILGLSELWCSETNTFVFPWGEATITLEDVMILGGLPVLGDPAGTLIEEGECSEVIVQELTRVRRQLHSSSKEKKPTYRAWLRYFMENGDGGELEHAAFLSCWLSRFVFPDINEQVIGQHVFPIAAIMTQRTQIALAPAVLASLYQNLSSLTKKASDLGSESTIFVPGPFQLVQLWACERFPVFGNELAKPLSPGDKRTARWDKVKLKVTLPQVRSTLKSISNFEWRPYAVDLENWDCNLLYYDDAEEFHKEGEYTDDDFKSFHRFLHCKMLFGIDDCQEKYQPHRVAMQFGLDQDIPGHFVDSSLVSLQDVEYYVPPRVFEPGVSERYYRWQWDCRVARKRSIMELLEQRKWKKENVTKNEVERKQDGCSKRVRVSCEKKDFNSDNGINAASEKANKKGFPNASFRSRSSNGDMGKQISKDTQRHASVNPQPASRVNKEDPPPSPPYFRSGCSGSDLGKQKSKNTGRHASVSPQQKSIPGNGEMICPSSGVVDHNDHRSVVSSDEACDDLDHVPLALRISPVPPSELKTQKEAEISRHVAPDCAAGVKKHNSRTSHQCGARRNAPKSQTTNECGGEMIKHKSLDSNDFGTQINKQKSHISKDKVIINMEDSPQRHQDTLAWAYRMKFSPLKHSPGTGNFPGAGKENLNNVEVERYDSINSHESLPTIRKCANNVHSSSSSTGDVRLSAKQSQTFVSQPPTHDVHDSHAPKKKIKLCCEQEDKKSTTTAASSANEVKKGVEVNKVSDLINIAWRKEGAVESSADDKILQKMRELLKQQNKSKVEEDMEARQDSSEKPELNLKREEDLEPKKESSKESKLKMTKDGESMDNPIDVDAIDQKTTLDKIKEKLNRVERLLEYISTRDPSLADG